MRGALAAHGLLNNVNSPETPVKCAFAVNGDTEFSVDEFRKIEQQTGQRFTVDACCNDSGLDSHCATFYSPTQSFLRADVAGQHVWLHPPFNNVYPFIAHYLQCKAKSPLNISACIYARAVGGHIVSVVAHNVNHSNIMLKHPDRSRYRNSAAQ